MKIFLKVPYGIATTWRLGSFRDADGQPMTPSFTAGDAKVTQDDGVGTDNLDTLPTLDGTDVILSISAAESKPPTANGSTRMIQIYDQTVPPAWIACDVRVEIEGRYGSALVAYSSTTFQLDAGAQTAVNPVGMVAIILESNDTLDVGHAMRVTSWVSGTQVATGADGWTRTPTGTASSIKVVLYAAAPALMGLTIAGAAQVNAQADQALVDIRLDHLLAVAESDDVVDNSIMAKIASIVGDWSDFIALGGEPSLEGIYSKVTEQDTSLDGLVRGLLAGRPQPWQATSGTTTTVVTGDADAVVDDAYVPGFVYWVLGNNLGMVSVIESFAQATGTFTFAEALPFAVQNGDTFQVVTIPSAAGLALDDQIGDSTVTVRQVLKLLAATLGGKASGLDTNAPKYRNVADNKNVVDAVTDAFGNRTGVTLDLS